MTRVPPILVTFVSGAVLSCASVSSHVRDAATATCKDILGPSSRVLSDPAYRSLGASDRQTYEHRLAQCKLTFGDPKAALDLSDRWPSSSDRDEVRARAEAALHHDAAAREALEKLASESALSADFLVDTTELWPYSTQDWYVSLAIQACGRGGGPPLDELASALMQHGGGTLVQFERASADEQVPPGGWALWIGDIQDVHVDHAGSRTVIRAEGLFERDEVATTTDIVAMEPHWSFFLQRHPDYLPSYRTTVTHRAVLSRSGRPFLVRYPAPSADLASVHTLVAFGRYAGQEDGVPVLDAIAVVSRDRS
jgi:hypothetical protein